MKYRIRCILEIGINQSVSLSMACNVENRTYIYSVYIFTYTYIVY